MPRTRQLTSAAAPPAEDDHETPEAAEPSQPDAIDSHEQGLRFNKPLSWRVGRPIPVSDLLSRLQALFNELCDIDQDESNRASLTPKAQELAGTQLLAHKDKGVRAWALLCITKMFHLLAPNAPYKAGQLRDIFSIFATQVIPAFADSTDPYYAQYIKILAALSDDKSVLLILDIPNWDVLTTQIFENTFDVVAGSGDDSTADRVANDVEYQLGTMLADIIQEADSLPNEVVDVVLAQFLRADTALTGYESGSASSPAYNMARVVCNNCIPNMTRYVSMYYSAVLLDASEAAQTVKSKTKPRGRKRKHAVEVDEDDEDDTSISAPTMSRFQDAGRAHRLLRELWRSSPDIIQGVIPQIEAEICAEDAQLRVMAVQAVGDMVSGIGATGFEPFDVLDPSAWPPQSLRPANAARSKYNAPYSFSKVYPDCYQAFVDRCRDKSHAVRSVWVAEAGRIFATNAGGKGLDTDQEARLLQIIKDCAKDNDEQVRHSTIEALSALSYSTLVTMLDDDGSINAPGSLLSIVADRLKDVKAVIRPTAFDLLSKLWGVAAGALADGGDSVHSIVMSIPTRVLDARYVNQPDVNYFIPQAIHDSLLPVAFPPIKANYASDAFAGDQSKDSTHDADAIRAERILTLVNSLDDRTEKVFMALQSQQSQKANIMSQYLDRCEDSNQDEAAVAEINRLLAILCKDMLDPDMSTLRMLRFVHLNDRRNYQLVRFCIAPDSDYRKVTKAMKELYKRLEGTASPYPDILETLQPILKTSSMLLYNRSHVPTFMRFASTDERGLSSAANKLLKHIAQTSSEVFKIHAAELCQSLQRTRPTESTPSDPSAMNTLKTCVGFARQYPEGMPKDRAFYQAMTAYALYGSPSKTAKHAVSIIWAAAHNKEMHINNILQKCVREFEYGEPHFLSRLAAIAQLSLLADDQTYEERDNITAIAVKKIIREARTTPQDHDPKWTTLDEGDEDLTAKLLAIKILVNGVRGKDFSDNSPDGIATLRAAVMPVLKLLNTLIERDGELMSTRKTPQHHRSQLRLAAGVSLVKLCSNRAIDKFLGAADFNRLTKVCQDEVQQVREAFGKSLRKYLGRGKLPSRFLALTFLYTFEPNTELKQIMQTFIRARADSSRQANETIDAVLEAIFPRLLSLVTHHPDFSMQPEQLQQTVEDTVQCILFYLTNVATEGIMPSLYNIAQRLKTVQDGIDPSTSSNLYLTSEIAEATIRAFHDAKGWVLQSAPHNVRLCAGLFTSLPANNTAQDLAETRFMPEDMMDMIPDLVRASLKSKKRKAETVPVSRKVRHATDDPVAKIQKKRTSNGPARKRAAASDTPEPKSLKKTKAAHVVDDNTRRRSARSTVASKNYVDQDSDEDDKELEKWNGDEANKENHELVMTDTPPTSEPLEESAQDVEMTTTASSPPAKIRTPKARKSTNTARTLKGTSTRTSARRAKKADEYDIPDDSD